MKRALIATLTAATLIAPARGMDKYEAAIKLATIAIFVEEECPGLKVNKPMLTSAVNLMGVEPSELQAPARVRQAMVVMNIFKANRMSTCVAARRMFGPAGEDLPGIFEAE